MRVYPLKYSLSTLLVLWLASLGGTLLVLWVVTSDRILGAKLSGDISFGMIFLLAAFSLSFWALILYQCWSRWGLLPWLAKESAQPVSWMKLIFQWHAALTLGLFVLADLVLYGVSIWYLVIGIIRAVGRSL